MSPAATQTATEAADSLLAVADELFYRRGIAAVTMAKIRDQSGVSLRRMYSLYPTKADLVSGWLEHRHHSWMDWLEGEVTYRMGNGTGPIDAVFDAVGLWLQSNNYRGCGFINSLAETGELTDQHRRIIRTHKQSLIDYLTTHTPEAEALAVLIDGAIVQAAVFRTSEPIEAARRAAFALVAA